VQSADYVSQFIQVRHSVGPKEHPLKGLFSELPQFSLLAFHLQPTFPVIIDRCRGAAYYNIAVISHRDAPRGNAQGEDNGVMDFMTFHDGDELSPLR
jgi:hypothetical protein